VASEHVYETEACAAPGVVYTCVVTLVQEGVLNRRLGVRNGMVSNSDSLHS